MLETAMDDFLSEIEKDSENCEGDLLQQIAALAELQIKLEGELDRLEQQTKVAKLKLNAVSMDKLPELMAEAKLQDFTLHTGEKIEVAEELYCSVPVARRAEIHSKLREDGMGDLITHAIQVDLARGQDNLAGDILGLAEELGLMAEREEKVNTSSLKKYLREQIDEGSDIELSFYGAYLSRRTKVK
jgi:hypothetical protein